MSETSAPNLDLPPPPRPVTRRASLRAWAEGSVQGWWKSALVVAIVTTCVTVVQVRDHLRERRLLEHGLPVNARIMELNDRKVGTGSYRPMRDVEMLVKLEGFFPDGRPFHYEGMLPKGEGYAEMGGDLQLRVDPEDDARWAEVKQQQPLWHEFMAVFLLTPAIAVLLLVAQWRRMGVLKVWQHGKVREGIVVDSKHSATAPRSRVLRFTIASGFDRRVFHTLCPARHGVPREGDVLKLLVLPEQPQRALIADFYARGGKH